MASMLQLGTVKAALCCVFGEVQYEVQHSYYAPAQETAVGVYAEDQRR